MALDQIVTALGGMKTVLDLFKGVRDEMPKVTTPKIDEEIAKAEKALKESKAELAKALGFRLCKCTFPGEPMLWNKDLRKEICPVCGDVHPTDRRPQVITSATLRARGGGSRGRE